MPTVGRALEVGGVSYSFGQQETLLAYLDAGAVKGRVASNGEAVKWLRRIGSRLSYVSMRSARSTLVKLGLAHRSDAGECHVGGEYGLTDAGERVGTVVAGAWQEDPPHPKRTRMQELTKAMKVAPRPLRVLLAEFHANKWVAGRPVDWRNVTPMARTMFGRVTEEELGDALATALSNGWLVEAHSLETKYGLKEEAYAMTRSGLLASNCLVPREWQLWEEPSPMDSLRPEAVEETPGPKRMPDPEPEPVGRPVDRSVGLPAPEERMRVGYLWWLAYRGMNGPGCPQDYAIGVLRTIIAPGCGSCELDRSWARTFIGSLQIAERQGTTSTMPKSVRQVMRPLVPYEYRRHANALAA